MTDIDSLRRKTAHIGVVGLGYVGAPLAAALGRHFSVYGFDSDARVVAGLRQGVDRTRTVDEGQIRDLGRRCTSDAAVLRECSVVIVAVPTPITEDRTPDLEPLTSAARTIGRNLKKGSLVVVESTVYPGVTEEVVGPVIADESRLEAGRGFHLGYSPERVNPGDHTHTVDRMVKVVAAESRAVVELMTAMYGAVTGGQTHQSASIRTAEAAKVIENTQRDLNIALMNELSMIFDRIGLDTTEVLRTASTKWNFARFEPGLVGGHCIGVDPYYLTHAAQEVGYLPQVILAGRRVNDFMGRHVADRAASLIRDRTNDVSQARVLVLGFAFKENVADVRNTRVVDVIHTLSDCGIACSVFDPVADADHIRAEYRLDPLDDACRDAPYDAVIAAVRHDVFESTFTLDVLKAMSVPDDPVLIDVKSMYEPEAARLCGFTYWRL